MFKLSTSEPMWLGWTRKEERPASAPKYFPGNTVRFPASTDRTSCSHTAHDCNSQCTADQLKQIQGKPHKNTQSISLLPPKFGPCAFQQHASRWGGNGTANPHGKPWALQSPHVTTSREQITDSGLRTTQMDASLLIVAMPFVTY